MTARLNRFLVALSLALLPLAATVAFGSGCELAVNINPVLAGSVSDVIDCSICADVSVDADYDAADVTIYGIQPNEDAGARDDASTGDALADSAQHG